MLRRSLLAVLLLADAGHTLVAPLRTLQIAPRTLPQLVRAVIAAGYDAEEVSRDAAASSNPGNAFSQEAEYYRGQFLGARLGAVGYPQLRDASADQILGGELAHFAGADQ